MIQPARLNVGADRWVACIRMIAFVGFDFTGATFAMQVRAVADSGGTPLVNLSTVTTAASEGVRLAYAGTDTVLNHIMARRLSGIPIGLKITTPVIVSQIGFRINETTMEGLPLPSELGDDAAFLWDLHITPSGGVKDKFAGGLFTVRAGVTQ